MGGNHFAPTPVALYGFVLLMSAAAFVLLMHALLRQPGGNPVLARAVGRDAKGKLSMLVYTAAIPLSFVNRWIACALYTLVAMMWLIPDPRIERNVAGDPKKL